MKGLGLPDVHEAILDQDTLDDLVLALETQARVTYVKVRGAPRGKARPSHFGQAMASLQDGSIAAVQVVYRWDGRTWLDTLTNTPEGIRLVRIAH